MANVFISYKREERDRCLAIYEGLTALKFSVWFDARLETGTHFDKEIEREVRSAEAVLVLWSPLSCESNWVRAEATIGQQRDVLISVRIADCTPPMGFISTHHVDLFDGPLDGTNKNWLALIGRVGKLTGRPGVAEFVSLKVKASLDQWKAWTATFHDDPLVMDVLDEAVREEAPRLKDELAAEVSKRKALEIQVEELLRATSADTREVRSLAQELATLKQRLAADTRERAELEATNAAFGKSAGEARQALHEAVETLDALKHEMATKEAAYAEKVADLGAKANVLQGRLSEAERQLHDLNAAHVATTTRLAEAEKQLMRASGASPPTTGPANSRPPGWRLWGAGRASADGWRLARKSMRLGLTTEDGEKSIKLQYVVAVALAAVVAVLVLFSLNWQLRELSKGGSVATAEAATPAAPQPAPLVPEPVGTRLDDYAGRWANDAASCGTANIIKIENGNLVLTAFDGSSPQVYRPLPDDGEGLLTKGPEVNIRFVLSDANRTLTYRGWGDNGAFVRCA